MSRRKQHVAANTLGETQNHAPSATLFSLNRISGWWLSHPSDKYDFSWDDYSQYLERQKKHVPNHQLVDYFPTVSDCVPLSCWLTDHSRLRMEPIFDHPTDPGTASEAARYLPGVLGKSAAVGS